MIQAWFYIFVGIVLLAGFTVFTGAPFVPSRKKEIRLAFSKLYKMGKNDLLIDLGSGDGKVVKVATEFQARAVGVELNPLLALWSKFRLRNNKLANIYCGDMFRFEFPEETTVVYVFSDSRDMDKIVKKIQMESQRLGKPLQLISLAFQPGKTPGVKLLRSYRAYFLYEIKG
ncbi:MAG: hypothetical protein Q4F60_03205 [Candidatus Saccharibacteria bacterium]|nr:hypothetical protein [Candidatus Saccharibacteria bacterium]